MVSYILLFLFLLLSSILFSDAKLTVVIHRLSEDDYLEVRISVLFGLIKYQFKVPYIDLFFSKMNMGIKAREEVDDKEGKALKKEKSIFSYNDFKALLINIKMYSRRYIRVFKYILSSLRLDYLKWLTEIGFNDAALTAVGVGFIWCIKSNITALVTSGVQSKNVELNVIPNYNTGIFEVDFHCIIRIKIVNIIIAGIRILFILLSNKILNKGGGSSERTSYSRANENYNG